MEAIDRFLLERIYGPIGRVAGERFGSTPGSLSRASIPPMLVFGLLRVAVMDAGVSPQSLMAGMLIIGLGMMFWFSSLSADNTPNPFSLEPAVWRVIWLMLFFVFAFVQWPMLKLSLSVCNHIACVSVIYFRALPSLPPKRRREARVPFGNTALEPT